MKRWRTVGMAAAVLLPSLAVAAIDLNSFKPGEVVSAAAMNQNFETLAGRLESVSNELKTVSDDLSTAKATAVAASEGLADHAQAPKIQVPVLLNGWVNYGGDFATVSYWKDAHGMVHLGGLIKDGTPTAPMLTLPAGYRPALKRNFVVVNGTESFSNLRVAANGDVYLPKGFQGFVSLDGVAFLAEQ